MLVVGRTGPVRRQRVRARYNVIAADRAGSLYYETACAWIRRGNFIAAGPAVPPYLQSNADVDRRRRHHFFRFFSAAFMSMPAFER